MLLYGQQRSRETGEGGRLDTRGKKKPGDQESQKKQFNSFARALFAFRSSLLAPFGTLLSTWRCTMGSLLLCRVPVARTTSHFMSPHPYAFSLLPWRMPLLRESFLLLRVVCCYELHLYYISRVHFIHAGQWGSVPAPLCIGVPSSSEDEQTFLAQQRL